MASFRKYINALTIWRLKNFEEKKFILLLSLIIGLLSGLAAIVLKNAVHYTHYFITNGFSFNEENYLYLAFPLIGILLTVLFVKFVVKDDISHGVSRILYSISRKEGVLERHHTYSSVIGSTLTIAFGGSVGLEAPIVLTGSAIGSNLGRFFKQNYKNMVLLIGCGTAGAIAGIFKSPIAAVVFCIEVLMIDLTMASAIPLLISAVTGASLSYLLMGKQVLFNFEVIDPFLLRHIPWFIVLGIFTGLVSLYFSRTMVFIEIRFARWKNPFPKLVLGSLALGLLIFIFPALYGEGYDMLKLVLNGETDGLINQGLFAEFSQAAWFLFVVLALVMIFKVIAMAITNGSGGIGGVFAPTLFMGGIAGFFVAKCINLLPAGHVSSSSFALVGMAGMMAGVMHAPLTAIFLIAELTGGYELFTPLIITATVSYLTIMYFEPWSVYTKKLAGKGELMTHHKDKAVLSLLKVEKLIETNFNCVPLDGNLGDFVKAVEQSERNVFPVIDAENNYYGVLFVNDLRKLIFKTGLYETILIKDLMFMPSVSVEPEETMDSVVKKFNESGYFNIPVIQNGKYIGFVSRANVFSAYRKLSEEFSED